MIFRSGESVGEFRNSALRTIAQTPLRKRHDRSYMFERVSTGLSVADSCMGISIAAFASLNLTLDAKRQVVAFNKVLIGPL